MHLMLISLPSAPPRGRDSERVGGKLKKGSKNRCHGTVTEVLPEMLPSVAVIVAVPFLLAFAKPFDPPALLILTTEGVDELQVTEVVHALRGEYQQCRRVKGLGKGQEKRHGYDHGHTGKHFWEHLGDSTVTTVL